MLRLFTAIRCYSDNCLNVKKKFFSSSLPRRSRSMVRIIQFKIIKKINLNCTTNPSTSFVTFSVFVVHIICETTWNEKIKKNNTKYCSSFVFQVLVYRNGIRFNIKKKIPNINLNTIKSQRSLNDVM